MSQSAAVESVGLPSTPNQDEGMTDGHQTEAHPVKRPAKPKAQRPKARQKARKAKRKSKVRARPLSDREINALPWEPLPGMHRVQCAECRFFYADANPQGRLCPDCDILLRRALRGRPLRIVRKGEETSAETLDQRPQTVDDDVGDDRQ